MNLNPGLWYIISVTLFFSFAFLFKSWLLHRQNNNYEDKDYKHLQMKNKILQLIISSRQNSAAIRGVIEDFDEKDYQIAFSKMMIYKLLQTTKPFKGYYLVNGSVKTVKNKIVLYYITKMEKIENLKTLKKRLTGL